MSQKDIRMDFHNFNITNYYTCTFCSSYRFYKLVCFIISKLSDFKYARLSESYAGINWYFYYLSIHIYFWIASKIEEIMGKKCG